MYQAALQSLQIQLGESTPLSIPVAKERESSSSRPSFKPSIAVSLSYTPLT